MKQKKKSPFDKYKNWIGMGLVLFVFVVVLLIVGKPSQSKSTTTAKKAKSTDTERTVKPSHVKKKISSEDRLAAKAQKKLERERKREERKKAGTGGGGITSTAQGSSRQTRSSSKSSAETGYVLKGIFVDERGERYALFGDHRTRNGDVVAGRKIQQVEPDRVSVEYGGSTYEVKIGNSLY
jgi:septal ring factor EnvC (AmiA/AmiB activator)